jgi:glycosyltransferase involved in cell wall biosynthesis
MPRVTFAVPGGVELRTGGAVYDRKIAQALREAGWWVDVLDWPGSFPFPSEADRLAAAQTLGALPDGSRVLIDGLALGVLPGLARVQAGRLRLAALVHHPLALETGLSPVMAATFAAEERDALAQVRAVIVTSQTTAAIVEHAFDVPGDKITVAFPGMDMAVAARRGPRSPGPLRLLAIGTVTPRKAHDILVQALDMIRDLDWTCSIAGSLARDPETADALAQQIEGLDLADRVRLLGEVSEAEAGALYAQADIFALASLYEGYGMVFGEAMAHGLPIVATTGGAIPEAVPEEAGYLVPPGDAEAFAAALSELIEQPAIRAELAAGARRAAARLPTWADAAAAIEAVLDAL